MQLLIIGNGFDIVHDLKTKYTDFLSFCDKYNEMNPISHVDILNKEFDNFLDHNIWLKYFLELQRLHLYKGLNETWIDFEKEVSEIIRVIEKSSEIKISHNSEKPHEFQLDAARSVITSKFNAFLLCFGVENRIHNRTSCEYILLADNVTNLESFLEFLYFQLREFTRAFEIYCLKINQETPNKAAFPSEHSMQIKKAEIKKISAEKRFSEAKMHNAYDTPDLSRLQLEANKQHKDLISSAHPIDYLNGSVFSHVLSFNYTNTYERLYGNDETKYCYIHGKAQENSECTNLILGIDDNLSSGDESSNFQCVRFKKYYQRIIYKTGAEYKDWIAHNLEKLGSKTYIHIVGHSLDRTDYDVLYEFFSDNRFKIIVYYYSPEDFEEKVQHVIQLLAYKGKNGRDELISRVHGLNWTIKFTYLYDEKDGLLRKTEDNT